MSTLGQSAASAPAAANRKHPGDAQPELTIVIVNWNGGEKLLDCLRSIRASRTSFPVKVILVDNDSADGSRERATAAFPEFRVVNTGANLGFGRGNNYARDWVVTPLVLFLNPDTVLLPDTLEKAVQSLLARPGTGMLGCQQLDPDGTVQELGLQWFPTPERVFLELLVSDWLRRGFPSRWLRHDPMRSGPVRKLYGGFLLARKEVLDAVGWFDEQYFMYAEDADLSRTVRNRGWDLYYEAGCAIIHAGGGASARAPGGFSVRMKQRSIHQLIQKYQGGFAAWRHRWAVALAAALRLCALRLMPSDRNWENARVRSRLLWDWAWHGREAAVPARPVAWSKTETPTRPSIHSGRTP